MSRPFEKKMLRDYQVEGKRQIYEAWETGLRRVLYQLPTGGGKTRLFANILAEQTGARLAIAHRQELVGQISLALASERVRHRIIAPRAVVRNIIPLHIRLTGQSYYDPASQVAVAGVDTLIRMDPSDEWLKAVQLWVMDEAHHVLRDNKWGKAVSLLPNARGLGVTATPTRTDNKGLGAGYHGVFKALIQGPSMRTLIKRGYLTPYKILSSLCSRLDLSSVPKSAATGDWAQKKLAEAVHRANIVGDTVSQYLTHAAGKRAVVFTVDLEEAEKTARAFNAVGVPAAFVSGKSTDIERFKATEDLRAGRILVLVNVDLFGEGFDLPAIECVIMARPTESLSLYFQQFGRALRICEGKEYGLIIDQVGNLKHGIPDAPIRWSLAGTYNKRPTDDIPLTACPKCSYAYERVYKACPYCGHAPEPANRGRPEFVDGDLTMVSEEFLESLRREVSRIDGPCYPPQDVPAYVAQSIRAKHQARQDAQSHLRESIAWWAGYHRTLGMSDSEGYRRFNFAFGVDVGTAQTLGAREALDLSDRVRQTLDGLVNFKEGDE